MVECAIFGGLLLDKYFEVDDYPERGQDGLITNEFSMAGGCSINMAATFNNLGGSAQVVSYLGTDQTGREIMEYLSGHGLSQKYVKQKEGETGYSLVFLEKNGERTFLTKKGAESHFDGRLLDSGISGMENVMVTGYYLLCDNRPELVRCLMEIRGKCRHFLFDPGPLIREIEPEILNKILDIADIITVNETEAESIDLARCASKVVVIKKGKSGGEVQWGPERFEYKAGDVEAVDTTGAGDSFAAGLMFGIASGMDLRSSVKIAVDSAAITVTLKGPHGFWSQADLKKENDL